MNNLLSKLDNIPNLPGVYKMLDSKGKIIYIGKSVSLRNRIRSYFNKNNKWPKVEKMVGLIKDIDYQVMDTNLEAMLEECKLIKEIKPIFNSQYKNHKKYVYLKIKDYNIYNSLSILYEKEDNSYGPFRSRSLLLNTIDSFRNLYPIVKLDNNYNFKYNIIPVSMNKEVFNKNKDSLKEIFTDEKYLELLEKELINKMNRESKDLRFEMAIYYKEVVNNLNYIKNSIFKYNNIFYRDIILKLPIESGYKMFYVNKGEIIYKKRYSSLNNSNKEEFIEKARKFRISGDNYINEKSKIDFHNILYSEIQTLPEDMIEILV